MTRVRGPGRRCRRALRAALLALTAVLALLATLAAVAPVSAAFSAATSNPVNSLAADQLQPPSALAVRQECVGATAVTFRGASRAGSAGSTPLVLPTPAGTRAGDLLLAQVVNSTGPYPLTAPAGWTLLRQDTSSSSVTSTLYWRLAGSAEPGTASFTFATAPGAIMIEGGIVAYAGVDPSQPIDGQGGAVGSTATVTTPTVTTTSAGALAVHLLAGRLTTVPPPATAQERYRSPTGSGASWVGATGADEQVSGPGTVSRTATLSAGYHWTAQTVVVRRVLGTPAAVLSWTASPSSWASGYQLDRLVGPTVQSTVTIPSVGTTGTTDGTLVNGTTYTFRLATHQQAWRSTPVAVTLAPAC